MNCILLEQDSFYGCRGLIVGYCWHGALGSGSLHRKGAVDTGAP